MFGPNLYPTVALRWVEEVSIVEPTRRHYLGHLPIALHAQVVSLR